MPTKSIKKEISAKALKINGINFLLLSLFSSVINILWFCFFQIKMLSKKSGISVKIKNTLTLIDCIKTGFSSIPCQVENRAKVATSVNMEMLNFQKSRSSFL
ncbi:MAG: hypothetical protein HN736_12205 [Anaerolineae bacterium]|nr:hypothetical protein [Anaerolineae bacterium]MBT3713981.1 hypothetical protein [Anaerolineae bacterium]MBT4312458.1 hypothetical protein [Anaerolineae bacterium]MBT4458716.1 hypothetical protein [Anaerolineae bacterium]MBT4842273.1 hypothetical protein [Anaerolineae bacterium]